MASTFGYRSQQWTGRRSTVRSDVWVHKRDMPSGKLCIRASSPYPRAAWEKQWRETSPGELTRKIPQIVRELEAEAGPIAKLVEEGERQAEIERQELEKEQRRWQREEAERRRKENIKRSRDQLLTIVESWSIARRIDAFFEDAERRTSELAPNEQKALADRLRRARDLPYRDCFGGSLQYPATSRCDDADVRGTRNDRHDDGEIQDAAALGVGLSWR